MRACDDVRARIALGEADEADAEHLATCAECHAAADALAAIERALAESARPSLPAGLRARALEGAAAELRAAAAAARRRERVLRAVRVCAAPAAAALLLPFVLAADLWLVGALRALAEASLPALVGDYVTISYALFLATLLAAAYAALPWLVARQHGAGGARGGTHA